MAYFLINLCFPPPRFYISLVEGKNGAIGDALEGDIDQNSHIIFQQGINPSYFRIYVLSISYVSDLSPTKLTKNLGGGIA